MMSPWGFGTFQDELACDWLEDLFDSDPIAFFEKCLDLDGLDYLEYLAGIGVLCTSEIVHGLCDQLRDGLPHAVHDWLEDHIDLDASRLLPSAISGMRRLLGPDSEIRERWSDNEEWGDEWFRHVADLLRLLEADLLAIQSRAAGGPIEEERQ